MCREEKVVRLRNSCYAATGGANAVTGGVL